MYLVNSHNKDQQTSVWYENSSTTVVIYLLLNLLHTFNKSTGNG
jgi:hypothetical protein